MKLKTLLLIATLAAASRLYGPLEPWFDKTWRPGEIEEVQ
jgi:hypothetical protein